MRRSAPGLLALLAGCNWVFGLDETKARPDAPPLDAQWIPIHLNLLQATLGPNNKPLAPMEVPIPDLAQVQIGTLEGGPLTTVSASGGMFTVPPEIVAPGWRLVYQRTGGVVREYQNLPSDSHVIEPFWGELGRTPPAAGTGYIVTVTGGGVDHSVHRVFTIGTWTEGFRPLAPTGATLDYDYPDAVPYSGTLGVPRSTDRAVLVDFNTNADCRSAKASLEFPAAPIDPKQTIMGPLAPDQIGGEVTTGLDVIGPVDLLPFQETPLDATQQYGFLPSGEMPAFARAPDAARGVYLPNPPILTLRTCQLPLTMALLPVHVPLVFKDNLPRAVHTEVTTSRTVGLAPLVNGLSILTREVGGMFVVTSSVAFATGIKLSGDSGVIDLMGSMDAVPVPAPGGVMTLTWGQTKAAGKASFWEVTLSEINGAQVAKRRIYTTLVPSVTIQASELVATKHYAVSIAAFSGRGTAAMGDFRGITDTQEMSSITARTFVVQ